MNLEEFTTFLDEQGFNWLESGKSLVLQDCPECGSSNYKVRLRVVDVDEDEPFFGRCQRGSCEKGFSSVSWALKMGVPYDEVMGVHGLDPDKNLGGIVPEVAADMPDIQQAPTEEEAKPEIALNIDWLKNVEDWPDHPCAQYAKKRGYVSEFKDLVKIDTKGGAVVFLVRNDAGECVGFQKRFLYPRNPKMKTKSSDNFKPSEWITTFYRPGADILLVEGPFTALSAWHYGFTGVCVYGASGIGDIQIKKAVEMAVKEGVSVGMAVEDDLAGQRAFGKIARFMYWAKVPIFKVQPETGNDLNDSWQAGKGFTREDNVEVNPAIPDIQAFF